MLRSLGPARPGDASGDHRATRRVGVFEAPTSTDLAQIYESLGSRMGSTTEEQEVTQWFAAAGLLLVLGGAGLAALWFNRFP